jgi:hypothetical protein
MKQKFTVPCDFGDKKVPVTLYIGNPAPQSPHPLNFQNKWLNEKRGGNIPPAIMDSFAKLLQIAKKNCVSFSELCSYVIDNLNSEKTLQSDAKQATALAKPNSKKDEE